MLQTDHDSPPRASPHPLTMLPRDKLLHIALGVLASDWQVQVTEQWMAGKTGVTI